MINDKKTTSQNARRWEFFDLGLCFDGPNLMVFELTELFQQTHSRSSIFRPLQRAPSQVCNL